MGNPWLFKKRIPPEGAQNTPIINTNIDKDKNNEKIFKNIKILYTNADQLNDGKKTELKETIRQSLPLIIAICEIKPKKITNRTKEDYAIPDFITYDVNLFKNNGRGIAIYIY